MKECTCVHCGKTFQAKDQRVGKYCSRACKNVGQITKQQLICPVCGIMFFRAPSCHAVYCGKSCARTALNLTDANPAFHRDVSGPNNPNWGQDHSGPKNPMWGKRKELATNWKGGRKTRPDGYVQVIVPDDHPYPTYQSTPTSCKYLLEHRRIMELSLGRYLLPEEVIHHKNGNNRDNRIENLELLPSQSEHVRRHGMKRQSV